MSYAPKTPSRKSRTGTRMPLTPSLTLGMNNLTLSAIPSPGRLRRAKSTAKSNIADTTNPFITYPEKPTRSNTFSKSLSKSSGYDFAKSLNLGGNTRSRPGSPVKKLSQSGSIIVTEELAREASGGIIGRGKGFESQFDILKNDYTPPPRVSMQRSRSQPAVNKRDRMYPREQDPLIDPTDRFITNRAGQDLCATLELMHLSAKSASPGHTARLVEATGLPVNKRVLAYHEAPPTIVADPHLAEQREIVNSLYSRPGATLTTSSGGGSSGKTRKIATQPERVLDAPGMVDDFYLNLISWSSLNVVAVALGESTYTWRADSGAVTHLGDVPEGTYVSAVDFSVDGEYLAIGTGSGAVELWDTETGTKLRTMPGHNSQIPSLAWNGHVVTSGCGDGSIWHHDVRIARHKVMELLGHSGEVCGLKWQPTGEFLASGGNDNVVNIWDGRIGESVIGDGEVEVKTSAKYTKRNHTAAVKAIAWCPWQPSLLATGGGTNDATINVWNTTTGARLHSLKTPSQITSLHFAPHKKELLSTHGFPTNSVMVHSYPSFERVAEIRDAHESRVLFSCVGPAGDLVLTGAGDENLKFWRIWEVPKAGKRKEKGSSSGGVREGIMAIR